MNIFASPLVGDQKMICSPGKPCPRCFEAPHGASRKRSDQLVCNICIVALQQINDRNFFFLFGRHDVCRYGLSSLANFKQTLSLFLSLMTSPLHFPIFLSALLDSIFPRLRGLIVIDDVIVNNEPCVTHPRLLRRPNTL
jgi:hypothetical protein